MIASTSASVAEPIFSASRMTEASSRSRAGGDERERHHGALIGTCAQCQITYLAIGVRLIRKQVQLVGDFIRFGCGPGFEECLGHYPTRDSDHLFLSPKSRARGESASAPPIYLGRRDSDPRKWDRYVCIDTNDFNHVLCGFDHLRCHEIKKPSPDSPEVTVAVLHPVRQRISRN